MHSEKWRWIPAHSVLEMTEKQNLIDLLRDNVSRTCSLNECDGTLAVNRMLLNEPTVFCLCIGWENDEVSKTELEIFCNRIPTSMSFNQLFDTCLDTEDLILYLG